jgi:hypothetical protein
MPRAHSHPCNQSLAPPATSRSLIHCLLGEHGVIEYCGLSVNLAVIAVRSNIFRICLCPDSSDLCSYGLAQVVTESHLIVTRLIASSGERGRESAFGARPLKGGQVDIK